VSRSFKNKAVLFNVEFFSDVFWEFKGEITKTFRVKPRRKLPDCPKKETDKCNRKSRKLLDNKISSGTLEKDGGNHVLC
jgi:hypothetical protein